MYIIVSALCFLFGSRRNDRLAYSEGDDQFTGELVAR